MRRSKALAGIRDGEIVRTCVLGHCIPAFVCHAARAGYDCIWLDLALRLISSREVQALLIPHVSTPEKAKMLVDAVKFPPVGDRGIDNGGLASDFRMHSDDDYVAWANRETFLCVQIETPQAVRNVESIAAVEGIDMIFVGPGDLGLRLRQSGEMTLEQAWENVAATCKRHGVPFGGPTIAPEELQRRKQQGAQLLVASSEFQSWSNGLKQDIRKLEA